MWLKALFWEKKNIKEKEQYETTKKGKSSKNEDFFFEIQFQLASILNNFT